MCFVFKTEILKICSWQFEIYKNKFKADFLKCGNFQKKFSTGLGDSSYFD